MTRMMARRMMTMMAASMLLWGCTPSSAPTAGAGSMAAPSRAATKNPAKLISAESIRAVTQELSLDSYEGRAPGTPGEAKTIEYIAKKFSAAGLQPGNKGSWYQDVPVIELTADPSMRLNVTGGAAPISLAYKTDFVAGTYRQRSSINIANSDMVFVGYGINAPERGWNDYAGVDVKGKTVIILINDPDYETAGLEGRFGGRAMTYYGRWTYKYEEAARQGAAAALIVHDTFPAAYPWDVVVSSWTGPQIFIDTASKGMDQTLANGWLTGNAADRLFQAAGKDLQSLVAAAKQPGFKAVPLGLKASLSFRNTMQGGMSRNVVGVLPGAKRPEESVLYTAHWDHLGRCEAVKGDDICNGAIDNATGIGGLIALAEAFGKAGPAERSVVFVAFTAEESGLLGSKYYAENPVFPLAKTAAGINMDGLNVLGRTRDVVVIGKGQSQLEALLEKRVKAQGRMLVGEPTPEKGFFFRSDHFSLAKLGVPMLYFDSGEDLLAGGKAAGRKAAEDYTVNRYHKPQDEFDPNWRWDGALEDMILNYQVGREIADSRLWPQWNATSEFRGVREQTASERK